MDDFDFDFDGLESEIFGNVTPESDRAAKYGREAVGAVLVVAGCVYSLLIFGALAIFVTRWAWNTWAEAL